MRLGKDLINKPIYSIDEGKQIGKVQDLYLDANDTVILGLYLGSQGLVRRKAELIRATDVYLYGADAVLANGSAAITDDSASPEVKEWVRRDKLIGREVQSPGGTRLGQIGDVVIDSAGRVTGFALSKTFVEGPLADKRYIERGTVLDVGQEGGAMTVDLVKLEASLMVADAVPAEVKIEEEAEGIADLPLTVDPSIDD
ncbi:MAG TPA: PRC-barrel domain-containing protein [Promineifilum sp.]|nr:PRC-barrel domain-containing protein [Promineifilum sp.]